MLVYTSLTKTNAARKQVIQFSMHGSANNMQGGKVLKLNLFGPIKRFVDLVSFFQLEARGPAPAKWQCSGWGGKEWHRDGCKGYRQPAALLSQAKIRPLGPGLHLLAPGLRCDSRICQLAFNSLYYLNVRGSYGFTIILWPLICITSLDDIWWQFFWWQKLKWVETVRMSQLTCISVALGPNSLTPQAAPCPRQRARAVRLGRFLSVRYIYSIMLSYVGKWQILVSFCNQCICNYFNILNS